MRRVLLLLLAAAALASPASASAAVTPDRDAPDVAAALSAPAGAAAVTAARFTELPPGGNPAAISDGLLGGFPTNGSSFAILSSGDAAKADPANPTVGDDNGGVDQVAPRQGVDDLTTLRIDLTVPANRNCAVFSFRFATDEVPGDDFNDGFVADLDTPDWQVNADGQVVAPHNFAFDAAGNVISVNSPGSTGLTPEQAEGTAFGTATARLTAATPVTPGSSPSLHFSIFDQGDEIVDSAVFLDDLDLQQRPAAECVRGAQDEIAPAVTLTAPGNGAASTDDTPTFAGAAGEAAGDAASVGVEVRSGDTVVATITATRAGATWSVDSSPLGAGTYSVRATQRDEAGNTGVSETRAFTVLAQPVDPPDPPDEPDPVPVLGKSVVASVVSGIVRIKGKNGKFRRLRADEAIPLGSTVDATKGRVHITSAAGGGKTQAGDFYQGMFVITQTRGAKPITQLALAGKLSCATKKKKASTSAKRKVRRLWGDGKGRFRTKGKHGAATVRGTKWLTEDRCGRTKVTVKRGSVVVRDFARRKNKVVKKGQSYVARAR